MGRLMRFEWRKLLRSKYLYIILAVQVAFVLIGGLTTKFINELFAEDPSATGVLIYDFVKGTLSGTFITVLAIFIAIFACEDSSQGTDKNVLAKGYNKRQVFFSKYFVSMIATLCLGIIALLVAYVFGLLNFRHAEITDNLFVVFSGQLLGLLANHALFFSLAYSFAKIGPAIAINIVAPTGVSLLLTMGDAFLNSNNTGEEQAFSISRYWVDSIFGSFTGTLATGGDLVLNYVLLVIYLVAFFFIGFFIANKKEVK